MTNEKQPLVQQQHIYKRLCVAVILTFIGLSTLPSHAKAQMNSPDDRKLCAALMTLAGQVAREAELLGRSAYETPIFKSLNPESNPIYNPIANLVERLRGSMTPSLIESYSAYSFCHGVNTELFYRVAPKIAKACNQVPKSKQGECISSLLNI